MAFGFGDCVCPNADTIIGNCPVHGDTRRFAMSVPNPAHHRWDAIRGFRRTWDGRERGAERVHESVFRSFQILREVRDMLERGDSRETIAEFIRWCDQ